MAEALIRRLLADEVVSPGQVRVADPAEGRRELLDRQYGVATYPEPSDCIGGAAVVVLAVTPNDQDNLVACQLASRLYGVPRSIALVNAPDNEEVFKKLKEAQSNG